MTSAWPILFGALFTSTTAIAAGLLLIHYLRIRLHRHELIPFAFVSGSSLLSTFVFLLLALWIAKPWVFALTGCVTIGWCLWRRAWRANGSVELAPVPVWWKALLTLGLLAFGLFMFAHALAPETSPDGTAYHLGTVGRYFRNGGFDRYTTNMYANMPMGVEMLFLFAYSFGRHSAAALVHWQFTLALPFLLLNCARRFGHPVAGAIAALLIFLSPVVGIDGASAYVDLATAAVVFTSFYALLVWEQDIDGWALVPAGLLSGWAYACKMTAALAMPFAIAFVAWKSWRMHRPELRPALLVAALASVMVTPWVVKSSMIVGNPVSPFMNRWFPNPYVRVSFEEEYRDSLRTYYGAVKSPAQIPVEVTVRGGKLNGLLGPVFLLMPLGLLALRWPLGRRALAAMAVYLLLYPNNIGTRFLLTALPFGALALGLVLQQWRGMGTAVILFHAFLSWPGVVPQYADEHAWRLDRFRWKAAIRRETEDGFLSRYVSYYKIARLIEDQVPPNGRVLTYGNVTEAYTTRDILVVYEAGLNNTAGETLAAGISPDYQATRWWDYRFAPRSLRRLRLVQTRSVPEMWSVSEIRLFSPAGTEIPRDEAWRIRAAPNPWDIGFAFDNCPITRWRGWQAARGGEAIEIDLGRAREVGAVRVELSPDQRTAARLEADSGSGRWETVAGAATVSDLPPLANARITATDDLKRLGITHLAIDNSDYVAADLLANRKAWGVTLLGEASGVRLYRLD